MFKQCLLTATLLSCSLMTAQAAVTDMGYVTVDRYVDTMPAAGSFQELFSFTVGPNAGFISASVGNWIRNSGISLQTLGVYSGSYTSFDQLAGVTALAFTSSPVVSNVGNGLVVDTVAAGSNTPLPTNSIYTIAVTGTSTGGHHYSTSVTLAPVPEPETYAMLLAGLGVMGFVAKRRKKADAGTTAAA